MLREGKGNSKVYKNYSSALHISRIFSSLDVIQVKKTKFGHHFVVLERIARVKNALINLSLSEEWEKFKKGGARATMEHNVVKEIVLDDDF